MRPKLIDALFREYFLLGRDIGRADVLQALAARCGITGDPDASPLPKSAALIDGVPFFRFGERISLVGALPPATLLNALERALGALDDDVQGGVTPACLTPA